MTLTGPEKAVLMLLSLDEATAAPIVGELDDVDLRKLREVAAMMRAVPSSALEDVYGDFVDRAKDAVAVPRGGVSYLRRLTSRALGETRSQEIFTGTPQTGLDRIASADPASVAALLEHEHPQLAAAIISQLEPGRAARIFQALSAAAQAPIITRLGAMTEVPAGMLEGVAAALAAELPPPEAEAAMSVDGIARAAGLLRKVTKEQAAELLDGLGDDGSELAQLIRHAMYTFEDMKALDPRALRTILKEVQQDRLVLALKTASEALKERIFASMSSRAAELLRDDLATLGGVRLADVEAAQLQIVETAMRLESEGQISLGGDEDLV